MPNALPCAWRATRFNAATLLAMVLIGDRFCLYEQSLAGNALRTRMKPVGTFDDEGSARVHVDRWKNDRERRGFVVAVENDPEPTLSLARITGSPTNSADMDVIYLWEFDQPGASEPWQLVVARDRHERSLVRIEPTGGAPTIQYVYPDMENAIDGGKAWIADLASESVPIRLRLHPADLA